MDERQTQILNFINNNEQTKIELTDKQNYKTIYFKLQINNKFDYIYIIDYCRKTPDTDQKPEFGAIVEKETHQIYFASYHLKRFFEEYNKEQNKYITILNNITIEEVNEQLNNDIKKELEKLAETVADDQQPSEEDTQRINEDTPNIYYYNKETKRTTTRGIKDYKTKIGELLEYLTNPTEKVKNIIDNQLDEILQDIKYYKMWTRCTQQKIKEIEDPNNKNYLYLRLAKQIKDSIPEEAKQVNIYYLLNNGEEIKCKYETRGLQSMPYWTNEKTHFGSWYIDSPNRIKIAEVNGRGEDDIYIKNIVKITYKNKELYNNPNIKGGNNE